MARATDDLDTRAVMALATESRRMRDAAERVDLVVRAMALRRGVAVPVGKDGERLVNEFE